MEENDAVKRRFVVDANVLFSCLISGGKRYIELFTFNDVFVPDYVLDEIREHQDVILEKTRLPFEEFTALAYDIFRRLIVVPNLLVTTQSFYEAFFLCRDIDVDDTPYVALSLQLGIPLLTRDKLLADGLRAKDFRNVLLLDELLAEESPQPPSP